MKKERVVQFAQELGSMVKQARDLTGAIADVTGNIAIAEKMNDTDRQKKLLAQRAEYRTILEKIEQVVKEKSNRADVEGAEKLLNQLSARLTQLDQIDGSIYTIEAQHELAASVGEFESEEGKQSRQQVEAQMARLRKQAETQLALAANLVPDKPVILSVL